jgi:predicted transposase/invertase (TIGR01784 family)
MPTPHDALFKLTFSDPAHAAPLLRTALPPALADRIDWDTLERLPTHFITEELRARQTDLLFRVRLRGSEGHEGHEARLILLFEHASQSERFYLLRSAEYTLLTLKDYLREHPKSKRLPAVIPVVLHHSKRGWTAAVELHQLMDLSPELKCVLRSYLLNHRIIVDDLSKQTDDATRQRVHDELAQLVLLLFKDLRHTPDVLGRLAELSSLIRQVAHAPSGLAALETVIKYILTVTKADVAAITHLFTTQISPEAGDLIMTTAKQLIQQGRVEGRAEGRAEGRRQTLAKLITLRFGGPDADTLARLQAASEEELDLWIERVLTAESLSELFA